MIWRERCPHPPSPGKGSGCVNGKAEMKAGGATQGQVVEENFETQNLTCMWKQLEMALVSLKNDDTIQVVGKMGNLVSACFDCIGR